MLELVHTQTRRKTLPEIMTGSLIRIVPESSGASLYLDNGAIISLPANYQDVIANIQPGDLFVVASETESFDSSVILYPTEVYVRKPADDGPVFGFRINQTCVRPGRSNLV